MLCYEPVPEGCLEADGGLESEGSAVSFRIGVTLCKHSRTGVGDKFCTPIQGESGVVGGGTLGKDEG
jgi:hypothetical protein